MGAKVIFRKIAGRIVPIRVAEGFVADKAVLESSAKLRTALKTSIAARTSLQEKRIAAVSSVRRFVADKWSIFEGPSKSVFDGSHGPKIPGKNWPKLGMGSSVKANADPLRPGWAIKSGASDELARRGVIKALLSKHDLAPETFHVQTKERDYLVQKIVKTLPDTSEGPVTHNLTKQWAAETRHVTRLTAKIDRLGMESWDTARSNLGKQGGKLKAIDAGMFTFERSLAPSEFQRVQKFRISGRDYLNPINQAELFKKRSKRGQ